MTVQQQVERSLEVFEKWRLVPAPARGELVRQLGMVLRQRKEKLAQQITADMGKTIREARGEIQEAIDMCDFAVGLSRQLYGLTMPSEREGHRIQEQWLPLGPVAVITAFNFPAAVWAWNFCIAAVCGNTVIWKPSPHAPKIAKLMHKAWCTACEIGGKLEFKDVSQITEHHSKLIAIELASHPSIPLVSATGSTAMGRGLGPIISHRLGRSILELGGNNAVIVSRLADMDLAVKGSVFSAVGTSGQRCTSLRRAFVHASVINLYLDAMQAAYRTIKIGDPTNEATLMGPLVSEAAVLSGAYAVDAAINQGGTLIYPAVDTLCATPYFMPTIIYSPKVLPIMQEETFAPILYVVPYTDFDAAVKMVNDVPQGLSAGIFSNDLIEVEKFMREVNCGLVNVNTGTSGAEIGGAFGGEKDTGGGRESGSDAWKMYMRRVTSTINFSGTIALAQGVQF